jgi:hypothetical protein
VETSVDDTVENELLDLIAVLDTALISDHPAVKDQLTKLLTISALIRSYKDIPNSYGPFRRLFEDSKNLKNRVRDLEEKDLKRNIIDTHKTLFRDVNKTASIIPFTKYADKQPIKE